MNQDRNGPGSLDDGPTFDVDSVSLPDEVLAGVSSRPARTAAQAGKKRPNFLALGIAGAVLGAIVGMVVVFFMRDPVSVEQTPSAPVVAAPAPTPTPAADPNPVPDPVAAPPPKAAPNAALAERTDPPPSKKAPTRTARQAKAKKTKGKRKKPARTAPNLDDALAKLDALDGESPSPKAPTAGTASGGAESAPAPAAPAPKPPPAPAGGSLAEQCSKGVASACVRAGRKAEYGDEADGGSRARQLYSVACNKKNPTGCWRLARLLERGVGGPKSPDQAAALRKKACELGHAESCAKSE